MIRLRILFDNIPGPMGCCSLWGFSVAVESPEGVWLFDTGSNGRILLKNAERMGVDLSRIHSLVISHPHWDHVGGLDSVLEIAPHVQIYLPRTLSGYWRRDLERMSGGVRVVGEDPVELFDGVQSTGIMAQIGEQAVLIPSSGGGILLTGCAHAGILEIVRRAYEMSGEVPGLVVGGFHLIESSEEEIRETIKGLKALGVESVCPTHCSGLKAIDMFCEAFGEKCLDGGVGSLLERG